MSNCNKKIDLKNAAEVFGLWDNVYGKDAIRSLENAQRWDPAKKEKEIKKPVKKVNLKNICHVATSKLYMRFLHCGAIFKSKCKCDFNVQV